MAQYAELFIYQGANFDSNITLTDSSTNSVINIASTVFRSRIKKSYASANIKAKITCTAVDSRNGVMQMTLTSSQTANLAQGRYVYNVMMTNGGHTDLVIEGGIFVLPDV